MQPFDFTTTIAACWDLRAEWLPARLEQVYQRDRYTIALALRTIKHRGWLHISWHPQAARICTGAPPPRIPDTFTFSDQLRHQLGGLALVAIAEIAPWERVLDLQFARRPGESALWHLYVEIMGKYSNVILANQENNIVSVAHQVTAQQSSVRPILTGQPYEIPPPLTDPIPTLSEPLTRWQERISLVPGSIDKQMLKSYRGLSSALVRSMLVAANINPEENTNKLTPKDWQSLWQKWQEWLQALAQGKFQPGFTNNGYTVMGWGVVETPKSLQELLNKYYGDRLNQQKFKQLHHQLSQKISNILNKLYVKANNFQERLQQSDEADKYRQNGDLLMANLHLWQPGMKSITLADFETGMPVNITLEPEKNAVQNAQAIYRQHQKLKRARNAVEPLLAEVKQEIAYLEQVEIAISQLETYRELVDLQALEEIREELISQKYLENPDYQGQNDPSGNNFYRYLSPGGLELLVGRNNRQNDQLTFRVAGDYDLWFHAQEIAGSHILLRVQPGNIADEVDLQFAADIAAFYSRGRQSDRVPVIYTQPKYVYKPKGAKPGMVVYKQERVIWGCPHQAIAPLKGQS